MIKDEDLIIICQINGWTTLDKNKGLKEWIVQQIKEKVMNLNKVQLQSKIQINQEQALKCLQFATEFMLSKAEYRLLNPLHQDQMDQSQIQQQSLLMAELSTYSFPGNKNMHIKKSKLNTSSIVMSSAIYDKPVSHDKSVNLDKSSPKSLKKYSSTSNKPTQTSGLLILNQLQSKQTNGLLVFNQIQSKTPLQKINPVSTIPPIKTTTSHFIDESLILKQQSNIKYSKLDKNQPLDFPTDQDAKSTTSKKNKKFQKVPLHSKKNHTTDQQMPSHSLNFKKKIHSINQKSLPESPIIKMTDSEQASEDQQDTFPLAKSNRQNKEEMDERVSLNSSDFDSYHSSILSDARKIQIHVVSEHASENDISVLSHKRKGQLMKGQPSEQSFQDKRQKGVGFKKTLSQNQQPSKVQYSKVSQRQRSSAQYPYEINVSRQQQQAQIPERNEIKEPEQQTPSVEQINSFLMKMESFEVQQQMLMKKLTKVWSRQSNSIKAIKQIKWQDLKLPKPTFRIQTPQYAQLIE